MIVKIKIINPILHEFVSLLDTIIKITTHNLYSLCYINLIIVFENGVPVQLTKMNRKKQMYLKYYYSICEILKSLNFGTLGRNRAIKY